MGSGLGEGGMDVAGAGPGGEGQRGLAWGCFGGWSKVVLCPAGVGEPGFPPCPMRGADRCCPFRAGLTTRACFPAGVEEGRAHGGAMPQGAKGQLCFPWGGKGKASHGQGSRGSTDTRGTAAQWHLAQPTCRLTFRCAH